MGDQGKKAHGVFDKFVTGMSQQSDTLGTKTQPSSNAANPPAIFPHCQLASTTDPCTRSDLVSLGHYVARVDTRLMAVEKLLNRLSERVTTLMALETNSLTAPSPRLGAMYNQPVYAG